MHIFDRCAVDAQAHVFEQTALKRQEVQEFQAALDKAMNTQNKLAEECIVAFAQLKKRASK